MRMRFLSALFLVLFGFTSSGRADSDPNAVNGSGSSGFYPGAVQLASKFILASGGKMVNVSPGGSYVGLQDLKENKVDVAFFDGLELPAEILQDTGTYRHALIAKEGIALLVNTGNPVENLTTEQVQQIYSGAITDWSTFGWNSQPIYFTHRGPESGSGKTFTELVLKGGAVTPKAIIKDSQIGCRITSGMMPGAISYAFSRFAAVKPMADDDAGAKAISLDGIAPTPKNIASGKYPVVNNIYIVWKTDSDKLTNQFVDFVCSKKGRKVIEAEGYIPAKE